ncbi:MAG TPA: lysine--tRNA ligase, partial [Actinobacteria bacterium]|nr:lysine--tRNA ligase [Actinomycetota bacterium]
MDDDSTDGPNDADDLAAHPLTARRLEKHLAALDANVYPYRFERTHLTGELHEQFADLEPGSETDTVVRVAGRMLNVRSMGKLTFAVLRDAAGRVQLFVDKRTLGDDSFAEFAALDMGDWIGVEGLVMTSKKGELSVRVQSFQLLSKSLRPFPDKWHGLQDKGRRY